MKTLEQLGISQHPWKVETFCDGASIKCGDDKWLTDDNGSMYDADARLIAAAPMLYEALRELVDIIELTDWNNKDYWPYTKKADAALVAAGGEEAK